MNNLLGGPSLNYIYHVTAIVGRLSWVRSDLGSVTRRCLSTWKNSTVYCRSLRHSGLVSRTIRNTPSSGSTNGINTAPALPYCLNSTLNSNIFYRYFFLLFGTKGNTHSIVYFNSVSCDNFTACDIER